MKLVYAARTDIGRVREYNEDAYLMDEDLGLFVVADGMGGHAAGEVASQEAVTCVHDHLLAHRAVLEEHPDEPDRRSAEKIRQLLERSVRASAYQVFGMTEVDPSRKGMGTTLSVILVRPQIAFVAHVGDSRVYMLREGRYRVVTTDHTFVAAMVREGKMTRQEARRSRFSNMLTRAVGSRDYVEVDTKVIRHQPGDTFFLCSDGLHRYLKKGELTKFLDAKNLNRSIDRLINMALVRGGRDNITAIALRVDP